MLFHASLGRFFASQRYITSNEEKLLAFNRFYCPCCRCCWLSWLLGDVATRLCCYNLDFVFFCCSAIEKEMLLNPQKTALILQVICRDCYRSIGNINKGNSNSNESTCRKAYIVVQCKNLTSNMLYCIYRNIRKCEYFWKKRPKWPYTEKNNYHWM